MKKIIVIVILVLLVPTILIFFQVNRITRSISNSVISTMIKPITQYSVDFRIYQNTDKKEIRFKNNNSGNELFQKIKLKSVKKISGKEGFRLSREMLYYIDYNSGKDSFYIDNEGRILGTRDKADVRNTSRLHWLWWKIDNLTDKYTGIYYLTEPDKSILDFVVGELN